MSGGPVLIHRYGARSQGANNAISAGTTTTLPYGSTKEPAVGLSWDAGNNRWNIEQPGLYWVTVSVEWDSTGAGSGRRVTNIVVNGTTYATNDVNAAGVIGTLNTETTTCTAVIPLAAGDTVSASVFSSNAANTIGGDPTRNYFMIHGVTL